MTTSLSVPESTTTAAATATQRVRLRFAKRGDLRLVSHHDVVRAFERMLRRAELPVAHSQGFNPRPKVVFPLSLALGIEGRREISASRHIAVTGQGYLMSRSVDRISRSANWRSGREGDGHGIGTAGEGPTQRVWIVRGFRRLRPPVP